MKTVKALKIRNHPGEILDLLTKTGRTYSGKQRQKGQRLYREVAI